VPVAVLPYQKFFGFFCVKKKRLDEFLGTIFNDCVQPQCDCESRISIKKSTEFDFSGGSPQTLLGSSQ